MSMSRHLPVHRLAFALSLLLAASAVAQELDVRALTPVEPTVADTGPLSLSLRELQVDFRGPVGFENIYRVPGYEDDLFMRVDGAIYAVFPQSVYANSQSGPVPLIPHGTIFYIGSESMNALTALNEPADNVWVDRSGLRIDSRIDFRREAPEDGGDPNARSSASREAAAERFSMGTSPSMRSMPRSRIVRPASPGSAASRDDEGSSTLAKTIATDETYRADRLRELMRRAAEADAESAD
jgi:hypothetical protein